MKMDIIEAFNREVLQPLNERFFLKYNKSILETEKMSDDINKDFQKHMKTFNEKYFKNRIEYRKLEFYFLTSANWSIKMDDKYMNNNEFNKYLEDKYFYLDIINKIKNIWAGIIK